MSEVIKKFEKDIIKTYRKDIWSKFIKGIKKYNLVEDGDKIAIAMSGGKDSLLMAKLFQELQKHSIYDFEIEVISMDPGFSKENLEKHFYNAKKLGIPLNIAKSEIFKIVEKISNDYPCYMCAKMRRGFLYTMARERDCNKLALGHHFDDVIETTMLNILYAGTFKTMIPKVTGDELDDIQLIRPMYLIKEKDIVRVMNSNNIKTMDCGCEIAVCSTSSKRHEVKQLIQQLRETSKDIDKSIFKSTENVDLSGIIAWKKDGVMVNRYDEKEQEK